TYVVPQPRGARSEGDALGRPPIDVPRCTRHRNRIPFRITTDFIALEFSRRMRLHARLPETNASARAHVALIMPAPATTIVVTTLPVSVIADRLDPELQ
ncbi:hypothetical protein, partial [Bradyrhizobium sp. 176]|uniref:hypothetical protein n=1 Tax=Bradyrhizobium sp. 176 TaxID=2782646 RepID=UPI001FFB6D57